MANNHGYPADDLNYRAADVLVPAELSDDAIAVIHGGGQPDPDTCVAWARWYVHLAQRCCTTPRGAQYRSGHTTLVNRWTSALRYEYRPQLQSACRWHLRMLTRAMSIVEEQIKWGPHV